MPAFGYERFDRRPVPDGPLGEVDILTAAQGLHGRLGRDAWTAMAAALPAVQALADDVVARAAGRAFWELPEDEFSVLAEPGTVGALLRQVGDLCAERGLSRPHVVAALHHRHPELVPLLHDTTRWPLLPHVREGDSGVEAVVHRELLHAAGAFAELEDAVRSRRAGADPAPPARRPALAHLGPAAHPRRRPRPGRSDVSGPPARSSCRQAQLSPSTCPAPQGR